MLEEQQVSSATTTPQSGNRLNQISSQSYKIITQYGDMLVIKQGIQFQQQQSDPQQSQQRPIIMTFHDLGLNSELQFATFCECEEVKLMLKTFTMIHVNFIGQEFPCQQQQDSPLFTSKSKSKLASTSTLSNTSLPEDFKYPNMEQMAESIVDVCAQLRIRSFIAIAVGAGAHIVGNLALLRPDLVDGLFLINPVITSCSITEWLYFKMSAIASNQSISSWNSGAGFSSKDRSLLSFSGSSSNTAALQLSNHNDANKNLQSSPSSNSGQHKSHHSHGIGFKKLLHSAAHLHFPHPLHLHIHHHHHHNKHKQEDNNQQNEDENDSVRSFDSKQSSPKNHPVETITTNSIKTDSEAEIEPEDDTKSISTKLESSVYVSKPPINKPHSGSRLRQLIFSRSIKNTTSYQQQQQQQQQQHGSNLSRTSSTPTGSQIMNNEESEEVVGNKNKQYKVKSSDSNESIERSGARKKPPTEYLMYHHFGPVSFQTYRRSSDTPLVAPLHNRDSPHKTKERPQSGGNLEETIGGATSSDGTCSSKQSSGQNSPATPGGSRTSSRRALANQSRPAGKCRSGSVCMDSIYLSSFENDRQKGSYVQSVYKHYFHQINSHNLWLFAQSFAKRRSLNLRKDCGAAAHAAAAAATLGTSICSAFVGITPGPALSETTKGSHRIVASSLSLSTSTSTSGATTTTTVAVGGATQNKPSNDTSSSITSKRQQVEIKATDTKVDDSAEQLDGKSSSRPDLTVSDKQTTTSTEGIGQKYTTSTGTTSSTSFSSQLHSKQNSQQPKALVAGTKVKRTFTCQTLIMCSSVQMHRERAFKLMSLLNPLQATWIQTDHLLVLEEKPEKVCQALRLFLQGIGYSMSTYERRLRLSSTTGSAGSADSNNSAPSISEKQHY